jgi:chemotaxis protein methyltransferase CheR
MDLSDKEIEIFISAIGDHSEYNFSDYTYKSLKRRVSKLLADHQCSLAEMALQLRNDRVFLEQIVRETTVSTTEMFRDPLVWQSMRSGLIPRLRDLSQIRIWSAGCSTGQEVYSLLILLNEYDLLDRTTILGTDLNSDTIEQAKTGIYKYRFNINYLDNFDQVIKSDPGQPRELIDVPYEKYFEIDQIRDTIKVKDILKNNATFFKHDLVEGPNVFDHPFDFILCRNVVIYFNYGLQNRVFRRFYDNLTIGGTLLLGLHESILGPYYDRFVKTGYFYLKSETHSPSVFDE